MERVCAVVEGTCSTVIYVHVDMQCDDYGEGQRRCGCVTERPVEALHRKGPRAGKGCGSVRQPCACSPTAEAAHQQDGGGRPSGWTGGPAKCAAGWLVGVPAWSNRRSRAKTQNDQKKKKTPLPGIEPGSPA